MMNHTMQKHDTRFCVLSQSFCSELNHPLDKPHPHLKNSINSFVSMPINVCLFYFRMWRPTIGEQPAKANNWRTKQSTDLLAMDRKYFGAFRSISNILRLVWNLHLNSDFRNSTFRNSHVQSLFTPDFFLQIALYKEGEFQCGGVLISNQYALSAAHCFHS